MQRLALLTRPKVNLKTLLRLLAAAPLLAMLVGFPGPGQAAGQFDLVVVVKSLRSTQGAVHLAIWRDPKSFTNPETVVMSCAHSADSERLVFVLEGLAEGRYAMASYHDENGNGEFDLTWIGLPGEGLGFSNGAWIGLGPPSFEEASFDVRTADQVVEIALRY